MIPILLGLAGVGASAVALLRAPAEHSLATWSAIVGVTGVAATAVLAVVLPPISFHPAVLWGLVGVGVVLGLLAGSAVGVRRGPGGVAIRGGAWHLMPAAVALLALQGAGVAESADGAVFATAAIVVCTAFAGGAVLVVAARGAGARPRSDGAAATATATATATDAATAGEPTAGSRPSAPGREDPARTVPQGEAAEAAPARRWLHPGAAAGLGAVVVLAGVAALVVADGGNTPPSVQTPAADSASSPTPSTPESAAPATPDAAPAGSGARYIGLTYPSGDPPAGVGELGGGLLVDTEYATAWMSGPEGDMFWLLREAGTDPDGSVTAWQVGDVVAWPQVEDRRSAQVVSGAVLCEIDGETADGVVAVFPAAEGEWFTDPYAAWQADTRSGKLRPVSGSLRCLNEGYGV